MVFSGSAGTRPDCSFAFKFPINQSITQSTVYDATLIVQLNAFYRSFTVSCTTLFSLSGATTSTSYMIFRVPGQYNRPLITVLNFKYILCFLQRIINQNYICTLITTLNFKYILVFSQGIINQNYICTPVQLSTGTCGEMSGALRAGGQPAHFLCSTSLTPTTLTH